ncbi:MAG: site-2 protease family protein [Thiohalorhabdaceae bacterium]
MDLNLVQIVAAAVIPVLFAITLHEVAHGWVARVFGDQTAFVMGRLSLNPLRHVDPVGTVALPAGLIILGYLSGTLIPIFGWAKPVPVHFGNLTQPKRDMIWVALAGPGANLLMALFWSVVAGVGGAVLATGSIGFSFVVAMGVIGIYINLILMVLNLLPLPPLDGGRVAVGLLPQPASRWVSYLEPFGLPLLLILLFTGALGSLIIGPFLFLFQTLFRLSGLEPSILSGIFG